MRRKLPPIEETEQSELIHLLKPDAKVQQALLLELIRQQNAKIRPVTLEEVLNELPEIKRVLQNFSTALGRFRGLKKRLTMMGSSYELIIGEKLIEERAERSITLVLIKRVST